MGHIFNRSSPSDTIFVGTAVSRNIRIRQEVSWREGKTQLASAGGPFEHLLLTNFRQRYVCEGLHAEKARFPDRLG